MEVSSEAKKGSEKDTFFKITSYIDFIGIFRNMDGIQAGQFESFWSWERKFYQT